MAKRTKEDVVEEFRRASIETAAMRAIARRGIDEVTIQDIADEAGVAKGTVYVYFRDREEVLAATADRLFDDLVAELEPAFVAEGSFAVRLHGLALRQLGFFDEHKALFRATLALSQRESDFSRSRSRCSARYTSLLEQLFTEAAAKGEIRRDAEPHTIASIYRDLVRGAISRRLDPKSKSKQPAEADARFIVSVLLHGIESGETS